MYKCRFCEKECSKFGIKNHERHCDSNPDRVPGNKNRAGIPSWNSGLVGDPRLQHNEKSKELMSARMKERTPEWHKANGKRISEAVNQKVLDGTWHTSLAKNMHVSYNGVNLHGSWELAYAQYLDKNSIRWLRNKDSFSYSYGGKLRRYTPDFYLIDSDEYVEIKGYKTEKDSAKWEQFPSHRKLIVMMKKELSEIGII